MMDWKAFVQNYGERRSCSNVTVRFRRVSHAIDGVECYHDTPADSEIFLDQCLNNAGALA